jgi:hypothetical protein
MHRKMKVGITEDSELLLCARISHPFIHSTNTTVASHDPGVWRFICKHRAVSLASLVGLTFQGREGEEQVINHRFASCPVYMNPATAIAL